MHDIDNIIRDFNRQHTEQLARAKQGRLVTANILYHMPDHPGILQEFTWQRQDFVPQLPLLTSFLKFWQAEIEGKLHSVTVGSATLWEASRTRNALSLDTIN